MLARSSRRIAFAAGLPISFSSSSRRRAPKGKALPAAARRHEAHLRGEGRAQGRGIATPRPISPATQELLGVPEIPRTQALKQIWAHIKQHNLQDRENKKIIV